MLYMTNQGVLPAGEAIDEQLAAMGLRGSDLDAVLLTHLDCDHANGLRAVKDAPRILVSRAELEFARKGGTNRIRYCLRWWEGVQLDAFDWNGTEGPAGHSYDVFGDGRLVMVNIPGHTDGLCAVGDSFTALGLCFPSLFILPALSRIDFREDISRKGGCLCRDLSGGTLYRRWAALPERCC